MSEDSYEFITDLVNSMIYLLLEILLKSKFEKQK